MKKLYEKNELLFALVCIGVYVVSMSALRSLGDDSPWMTAGLALISALMLLFVAKNGLTKKYGLSVLPRNSGVMLWFLPLWVVTSCNLWAGVAPHFALPGLVFAAVSMALVGVAEELIFRGFLFRAMLKGGSVKAAVIVSSVTFGAGHVVNLLTGHDLAETLLQIVFACAFGLMVTLVFYKGGSLLPCILAHSLTDVFSVFSAESASSVNWIVHGVTIALAAAYSLYLMKRPAEPALRPGAGGKA